MHPELSAMNAAAIQSERLAESRRVRTVSLDGADWPATTPPRRLLAALAGRAGRHLA